MYTLITISMVLIVVAQVTLSTDRFNQNYRVVCYWGSWSFYRQGNGKFEAEDTDPSLFTHLIYAFAKLNDDNTIGVFDKGLDIGSIDWQSGQQWGHGMYQRWNALRSKNPSATTLIAIGGWSEGSDKYSNMASNPSTRKTFVDSVVKFLQTYKEQCRTLIDNLIIKPKC